MTNTFPGLSLLNHLTRRDHLPFVFFKKVCGQDSSPTGVIGRWISDEDLNLHLSNVIGVQGKSLTSKWEEQRSARGEDFNYLLPLCQYRLPSGKNIEFLTDHMYVLNLPEFNATQGYVIPSITDASNWMKTVSWAAVFNSFLPYLPFPFLIGCSGLLPLCWLSHIRYFWWRLNSFLATIL